MSEPDQKSIGESNSLKKKVKDIVIEASFKALASNLFITSLEFKSALLESMFEMIEQNPEFCFEKIKISQSGYGTFTCPYSIPFYEWIADKVDLQTLERFLQIRLVELETLDRSNLEQEQIDLFKKYSKKMREMFFFSILG